MSNVDTNPAWEKMFKEFPNTKFVLHHVHNALKIKVAENVHIVRYDSKAKMN